MFRRVAGLWLHSRGSQYALCMQTQSAQLQQHAGRIQNARREYMLNLCEIETNVIAMATSRCFERDTVLGGR